MTQVDFYLQGETAGPDLLACRLADKAFRNGHSVYVLAASPQQADTLDQMLWTFSQGSFVPHRLHTSGPAPEDVKVLIGTHEAPPELHDVLISLAEQVPPFFSRFERVIEIVAGDENTREIARQRFRFYRDRGYPLQTHEL